ncbi:uncharacterized protein LOC143305923 [Osmia lignaria lignaria]|uniref:uncharacterized protein LOC143305923 n=1 Tax=Osmia lignaria lignaria TaxID=1437193 RepID=UPI00402B8266
MNNLEKHQEQQSLQNLEYGISSLHAWIKFFECVLHIAYRLDCKIWRVSKGETKEQVTIRKRNIQEKLRAKMGLLVDVPKPGYGTTNNGNTSRKFFSQTKLASEITGVNEDLIYRFSVILNTISSGYSVNAEQFGKYAFETAQLYVYHYNWYYMPQTVHKVLIHGAEIIKSFIVPIGQLSEEALESRHKDCKRFREHNTRKFSRKANIEDLFHMLCVTSDPVITNFIGLPIKKTAVINEDVQFLLSEDINDD